MKLKLKGNPLARHFARALALAALAAFVALAASCDLDGASKKRVEANANKDAAASRQPRTNLPMPPVEPAHASRAALPPRTGWTQADGRRSALEDYRGQVVVLDFWATYCPPCREEIPHLVQLQKRLGPQGLKVIGLNVGGAEDQPKIPDFVKSYGIQYQLANPDDATVQLFLADDDSIPHTFVIDRQGRLVQDFVGYDQEAGAELEQAITTALASKAN
jgi:thiol-disulfide isomerase/thioredoxin